MEDDKIKEELFKVLTNIQKEVIELESLFPEKIPIIDTSEKEYISETVVLTKKQIRALSCCSFFGIVQVASKKLNLQNIINISSIYSGGFHKNQEASKIKCFIHYLYRAFTDEKFEGNISFSKKFLYKFDIEKSEKLLPKSIKVYHDSTSISDVIQHLYQMS